MDVFTQLTKLQFHPATASVHSGAVMQVELTLRCLMPVSVRIEQLAASIHFDLERGSTNGRSKGTPRQTNPGTVDFHHFSSTAGPPAAAGPPLELDEMQDRSPSDGSLSCAGVVCKNTHLVMRRHDNSPLAASNCVSPPSVALKEGGQMLKVQDVTLEPGDNRITFTAPVRHLDLQSAGMHSSKCFFTSSVFFFFPASAEWTTRHIHTASALRHRGPSAVFTASHLPICPI